MTSESDSKDTIYKNKNIYCYFAEEMEPIGKMSIGSMISKMCRNSSATKVSPSIFSNEVDEMKSFYPGLFVGFVNWIWVKSTTLCLDLDLRVGAVWTIELGMMLADQYNLTKKV